MKNSDTEWEKYPPFWYELSAKSIDITGSLICRDLYKAYDTEYDSKCISGSMDIENRFINVIRQVMKEADCRYFYMYEHYPFLAYRSDCPLFVNVSEEHFRMVNRTRRVSAENIGVYVRLQLRNIHWFYMANMKKDIRIYFGNDYHVALYTRIDSKIIRRICRKSGIRFKTGLKTDILF